jgi:hypothetical protein
MLSPLQTAANVDAFMTALLPQKGQRHRSDNGVAVGPQSQRVSGCFIGGTLLVGKNVSSTIDALELLSKMRVPFNADASLSLYPHRW